MPDATPLVGTLMLGNLMKRVGRRRALDPGVASNALANVVTLFLGLAVGIDHGQASAFLQASATLKPSWVLGILAFALDTAAGVLFAKLLNRGQRRPASTR